jgi:outer membrane protein OmpA-like peptidoglycan-associated protein
MNHIMALLTFALALCSSLALADDTSLGRKDPGLYNLKGKIYFLEEGTSGMPEGLEARKVEGVIYTDKLDVPQRDFKEGFPGVTDRVEWFGILYTGTFQVTTPGEYSFTLSSDDGSRLWIDGKQIVDDDGTHPTQEAEGKVNLTKGMHSMKVWYYQGPMYEIALQLFVTPPGAEGQRIFSVADFNSGLAEAAKNLDVTVTPEGIKVNLDAAVLFDTAKWTLKPVAKKQISDVLQMLRAYPTARVEVSGHTDIVGDEAYNQKLSEQRAASVNKALADAGLPSGVSVETHGYGKTRPVADNTTEKGRAKNRRVEILIHP